VKTAFRKSFARDMKKIKNRTVLERFKQTIEDIERADELREVSGVKRMSSPGNFFRLRIGDYRVGIVAEGDEVEFVRFLHRRDIYRFFPVKAHVGYHGCVSGLTINLRYNGMGVGKDHFDGQ